MNVLVLATFPPEARSERALSCVREAALLAGIEIDLRQAGSISEESDEALAAAGLIIADEATAAGAAEVLARRSNGTPLLILCEGEPSEDVLAVLKRGEAECAAVNDPAAIASVLLRAQRDAEVASNSETHDASEQQARAMLDSLAGGLTDAAFIKDCDGRYVMMNQAGAAMLGRSVDEVLESTDRELFDAESAEQIIESDQCILAAGESRTFEEQLSVNGALRNFLTTKTPYRDHRGRVAGILGISRDITARKRAEAELNDHRTRLEELVRERTRELEESHQRLRLSERMAAMGTLSTGIGHDVGNLVLPLRIGLESLESKDLPPECESDLHAIRRAIEYLQGLANGLRYLAMDPEDAGMSSGRSELSEWWSDVFPLLKNCLPREVALKRDFAEDLPNVSMPMHHLTQIVFNLVQNAGDAFRGRQAPSGDGSDGAVLVKAESAREGLAVRLSVIDDGPGMTAEVRERCLEPFFTTKFRSVATGLGLPLVHGLVQKAGGEVELESAPGQGTRWTFTLPATPARARDAANGSANHLPGARVDLTDNRMKAYVSSVLNSLEFAVSQNGDGEQEAPTVLCVTEPNAALGRAAGMLLEEDEQLRVVLFGDPDGAANHPRLHAIGENPSSATIRATLRDIRTAIEG